MMWLDSVLFVTVVLAIVAWAALSAYILRVERQREATAATTDRARFLIPFSLRSTRDPGPPAPGYAISAQPAPGRAARRSPSFSQHSAERSILATPRTAGRSGGVRSRNAQGRMAMRWVHVALIVVFTGIVLLFKIQNLESATVTLFSMSITLPVSVLVAGIYVLGMLTGSFLVSLLRSWIRGARGVD